MTINNLPKKSAFSNAYDNWNWTYVSGMSLREWYVGQALSAGLSAEDAIKQADIVIRLLERKNAI